MKSTWGGAFSTNRQGGHCWVKLKYLPYKLLHKKCQYHLLEMLKEQVPTKQMQAKIDKLYRKYSNGLAANIQMREVPKTNSI